MIAALQHKDSGEVESGDATGDLLNALRGDVEFSQRVFTVAIHSQREHQEARGEIGKQVEGLVERFQVGGIAAAYRQGEVAMIAQPGGISLLIGVTRKVGVFLCRVGVDGKGQHVGAVVEDLLRAVASMIVNVQNGDFAICA